MKKVLLAGTALLGVAVLSAPAHAELKLDLGGLFRGYAVYSDDDTAAGNISEFDFRRDSEVHFTGETTLDNGLTVGVHSEIKLGNSASTAFIGDLNGDGDVGDAGENIPGTNGPNYTDETYMYVSSSFGRVNFGSEDGAAYLLQVAAPSADSNVDGLRTYIQAINANGYVGALDYDHADATNTDRLTYLTPKFNGFQAGVSYAPEIGQNAIGNNIAPMAADNDAFEDLWEVAARWDGEFSGFGLSAGAGFSSAGNEVPAGDDIQTWNAAANVGFNAFSLGLAYKTTDNGVAAANGDSDTWVAGAAWDNGPYHLGASYINEDNEAAAGVNAGLEATRYTVGGGYTFGPGMTFRGALAFGEVEAAATDEDITQFTLGTDIQF